VSQPKIPPFRADHVGSLLRPDIVKAARKGFYEDHSVSGADLASAEDEAIKG
jgi:5-methyltetrahydropteroyltriglutamate--homocysteine methyltransferase